MEKNDDRDDFTFMAVEDFAKKGRSKKYLYFMFIYQSKNLIITAIVNWFLPPFKEWTIQFLKGVLAEELIKYFPNTKPDHPQSRYFIIILCSLRAVETKKLWDDALKNRSIYKDRLISDYIKVSNKWIEDLQAVVDIPSKLNLLTL